MPTLALKLVLTPVLIGSASLIGRRFGPGVAGWLIGLPFTSGPITFFLALDHGEAFASRAAAGILGGTASQVAFALAYAYVAQRRAWPAALFVGTAAFGLTTAALEIVSPPLVAVAILAIASLLVGIRLLHAGQAIRERSVLPRWDLPARMVLATAFVLALTALAERLGPYLTGLLAPYPLYATILAAFAHQQEGAEAAARTLRGLLFGLFAFVGFFLVLAVTLESFGLMPSFALALLVALALEGASFRLAR